MNTAVKQFSRDHHSSGTDLHLLSQLGIQRQLFILAGACQVLLRAHPAGEQWDTANSTCSSNAPHATYTYVRTLSSREDSSLAATDGNLLEWDQQVF